MSLDLNYVLLSECKIHGNLNLSIISKSKYIATVVVFLSGMGVVMRYQVTLHTVVRVHELPCEVVLYGPIRSIDLRSCGD